MKIYLVTRLDKWGYDEYDTWVVRAKSPQQARSLCRWGDGKPKNEELKVEVIKSEGDAMAILGSFNAG